MVKKISKKPKITREETKVIIECFDEGAAVTCEKNIVKVLNNRMLAMALRRQMK